MNTKNLRRSSLAAALALGVACGTAGAAHAASVSVGVQLGARATVDIGFFQTNLQSYGRWVDRPSYGRVFVPRVSRSSWRPYSQGHWVETDYGSTWISDEPFGWATYHYGRWYADPSLGWVWVPGTEWGPAWVDFEESNGYIGWAPLPPSVGFDYGSGLRLGSFRPGYDVPSSSYCFVEERRFLEPRIATYIAAPTRNVAFIHGARRLTSYAVENQRVINRSLPVARLERATGRPVPRYQVADVGGNTPVRQARIRGNQVQIYRPQVVATQPGAPGRPGGGARESVAQRQARERQTQPTPQTQQAQRQQARAQQQQQRETQNQQAQQQRQQARQQQAQQRNQVQEQRAAQNQQSQQQRQEARRQQAQQRNQVREQRAAQDQQAQQSQQARQQQAQQRNQQREAQAQQQEQRRQAQQQQQQQRAQAQENRGHGRPPQAENRGGGQPDRPQHGGGGHGKPHEDKPREDKPPGR